VPQDRDRGIFNTKNSSRPSSYNNNFRFCLKEFEMQLRVWPRWIAASEALRHHPFPQATGDFP
jgi:hypothetical protein